LASGSIGVTTTTQRPLPTASTAPRATRADAADRAWVVKVAIAANAVLIVALWLRHGGLENARGPGGPATATGEVTALLGTYAVLIELLLMSRIAWLERHAGLDRIAVWHRWTGFAAVNLLVAHLVFTTAGYAAGNHKSLAWQTFDFIRHYPDVLMAFVALALLIAVAATSVRASRARVRRETWYSVHLYAYLAVALGFAHQIAVGSDFSTDRAARVYWAALYVAVVGSIVIWRVGQPVVFNARHQLRVRAVQREAPDVVSIYVSGRRLEEVRAQPGQFFLWRFLTRDGWYKAHPYSLSALPTKRSLRITVKSLGDESAKLQRVRPGTRVFAEGPFGVFTPKLRTRRKVLLIAGGIGITPLRAIVESLPGKPGEIVMLYRVATPDDAVFKDELQELVRRRHIALYILPGTEIGDDNTDLLGVPALAKGVPDIRSRDCFVCGPPGLIDAMRRRLSMLDVPAEQIHFERFEF
jgi:predicted ferric reductase